MDIQIGRRARRAGLQAARRRRADRDGPEPSAAPGRADRGGTGRRAIGRAEVVVAAMFVVAVIAWGIGFYGLGFYLRELRRIHGWSLQTVTVATMWFYVAGIGTSFLVRAMFRRGRCGGVFALGGLALAVSLFAMSQVEARWQLAVTYLGLALAWSCLNNYPISSTIVSWYPVGSGPPISLALTGASVGGMVVVPLLTDLEERYGFTRSVTAVGVGAAVVLWLLAAWVIRLPPGGTAAASERRPAGPSPSSPVEAAPGNMAELPPDRPLAPAAGLVSQPAFWTLTVGFGLALAVQVGFLVHQLNLLADELSDGSAARVVSATTIAALVGRLVFGALTKRTDPFPLTVGYLVVQAVALAVAALAGGSGLVLTVSSVAFGVGVGTLVTATPLLTGLTFPHASFERTYHRVNVGLQSGAAVGPLLATTLHDLLSGYRPTLATLAVLDGVALVLIGCTRRLAR
jgi:hypothetical protein